MYQSLIHEVNRVFGAECAEVVQLSGRLPGYCEMSNLELASYRGMSWSLNCY